MSGDSSTKWKAVVERLYFKHARRLYHRARRALWDSDKVADLVQHLFVNLLANEQQEGGEAEAEKLMFTSFHNLLVDYIRTEIRWKYKSLDEVNPGRVTTAAHQEDDLVRERLSGKQLPLPDRERCVFEMAYFEGKSDREIAESLQLNIFSLQRSLVRARRMLERIMTDRHGCTKDELHALFSRRKA